MGRTVLEKYEDEVGTHCAIHAGNVSTDGAVAILTKAAAGEGCCRCR